MLRLTTLMSLLAGAASAQPLIVQLRSTDAVDAAGIYVAQARGFYRDEGIDLRIDPPQPDRSPMQALADGKADAVTDWIAAGLVAQDHGLPVTSLEASLRPVSLELVCLPESGVRAWSDLAGRIVAVPLDGTDLALSALLSTLGLGAGTGPQDVQIIDGSGGLDVIRGKHAACQTVTAAQLPQVEAALPAGFVTLTPAPEHAPLVALHALRPAPGDSDAQDRLARLARATQRGWDDVRADPAGAAATLASMADAGGGSTGQPGPAPTQAQLTTEATLAKGNTPAAVAAALVKAGLISPEAKSIRMGE